MQIQWTSRQGRRRSNNCDAGALAMTDTQLFAIVVDAAERGPKPQEFAAHWGQSIISQLVLFGATISPDEAYIIMRQQQIQLRHEYLLEIGSYCLAILNVDDYNGTVMHTGDCLASIVLPNQPPQWLTRPHNLQQQPGMEAQANRHILTRSLNARRFANPHCNEFILSPGAHIELCSDGYLTEHLSEVQPLCSLEDDASLMRIKLELTPPLHLNLDSDCDNLHIDPGTFFVLDQGTQ